MSSMPGENMPSVKRGHLRQLLEKLVPAAGQAHLEQGLCLIPLSPIPLSWNPWRGPLLFCTVFRLSCPPGQILWKILVSFCVLKYTTRSSLGLK